MFGLKGEASTKADISRVVISDGRCGPLAFVMRRVIRAGVLEKKMEEFL